MGLEHSRRRSPINVFVPILSYLAAYSLSQNKGTSASSTCLLSPHFIQNWGYDKEAYKGAIWWRISLPGSRGTGTVPPVMTKTTATMP